MKNLLISLLVQKAWPVLLLVLSISFRLQGQESLKVEVIGEGKPVVLIPGLSCSAKVWTNTVKALPDGHAYHLLTLPGFAGQPRLNTEGAYLPKVMEAIVSYLRANELEQPIVIGHSLGGFLGLELAIQYPKLLKKVVVVDAFPFLPAAQNPMATVETAKVFAKNMKTAMTNQSEEVYKGQLQMSLKSMIATEDSIPVAIQWGMDSDRSTVSQAMYELYTTDLRPQLQQIEIPVLVLGAWIGYQAYGVTKPMIEATFNQQYQSLKGVKIKLSDKGKHFLMWDDPSFTSNEIAQFLSQ